VEGSRSKAENLNSALELVGTENVVIYDADHHADPDSLMIATRYMRLHRCQCVQGSTYIRYKPTLLARIIDAEFFVIFFCFFPAIQFLTRVGIFGGSNALWKTEVLRAYQFRTTVATEDVDLSTRVILGNVKIRFCPEARSGELPPASLRALWRQRLRWEIGWDQVSLSYFRSIYRAKDISCRKKFALYYWLPWRWLMLTTSAINAFVTPIVTMTVPAEAFGYPLRLMMDASLICFVLVTSFILCNAVLIARPRDTEQRYIYYFMSRKTIVNPVHKNTEPLHTQSTSMHSSPGRARSRRSSSSSSSACSTCYGTPRSSPPRSSASRPASPAATASCQHSATTRVRGEEPRGSSRQPGCRMGFSKPRSARSRQTTRQMTRH